MSPFEFVLCVLAAYRITRLINDESGPACIIDRIRYTAGVRRGVDNEQIAKDGTVARLLVCARCLSGPMSFATVWALRLVPEASQLVIHPVAVWGAILLILNLIERLEE